MAILTNTDARAKILDIISGVLCYFEPKEGVKENDKIQDIGMDSLDFIEIIMESEKILGSTIDETTWAPVNQEKTVRDLIDWIITFKTK